MNLLNSTALCLSAACLPLFASPESIAEFGPGDKDKLGWTVVDDGVMGGLSKGKLVISDNGVLTFNGKLSLENNGGFSSIRSKSLKLDLSDADGVAMRVKGDGRSYQLRFGTDARFRGMEISFMAEFPTEKGKWTNVEVPFDQFAASFRGMKLKEEVFDPEKVRRVGLLLADKNPGEFNLQIDWIRSLNKKSGSQNLVDTALADGRFGTLAKALEAAGLVEALQGDDPLTVFAPTDDAFAKLPKALVKELLSPEGKEKLQTILKYHVLEGRVGLSGALKAGEADTLAGDSLEITFSEGRVRVNESVLSAADISCGNGIIHVIDSVLIPPTPKNDIATVARKNGNFTTLLAAVEATGLSDVLSGDKVLTVFAPTDKAFAALPEGTVASLLKKENLDKLRSILSYHAVTGKVSAGDALNAKSAKALNGESLKFAIDKGMLKVNGATIVTTDIECDNGVIHVIDAVLLPTSKAKVSKKDTTQAVDPAELIKIAIEKGVPVFNGGDHEACAKIYEACLIELAGEKSFDKDVRMALKELVERVSKREKATERAWLYRGGLDHLLSSTTL